MRWLAVPAALHMNARIFMKPLLVGVRLQPGGEPGWWAAAGLSAAGRADGAAGRGPPARVASVLQWPAGRPETDSHVPAHPVVTQLAMIYWPPMALQDGTASL